MTFFQHLQSHKGGLIRLKTELGWYNLDGWDGNPGRVCILLDTDDCDDYDSDVVATTRNVKDDNLVTYTACLLIDGIPQWIWLSEAAVEIL